MRILSVYINNYKGIWNDMVIFADNVTCFTGPNNTGKHTLFDAMTFVPWVYESEPPISALQKYRRKGTTEPTTIVFHLHGKNGPFSYTFTLYDDHWVDYVNTGNEEDKKEFLEYAQDFVISPYLGISDIVFSDNETIDRIGTKLKKIFPDDVEKIWLEDDGEGFKDIMIKSPDIEEPFNVYDFSPAFVRMVQLLGMEESRTPRVLFLEDPDVGLDVRGFNHLLNCLERYCAKHNCQVFVLTHNPYFVSRFLPGEVYVSKKDKGRCYFLNAGADSEAVGWWESEVTWWYNEYIDA